MHVRLGLINDTLNSLSIMQTTLNKATDMDKAEVFLIVVLTQFAIYTEETTGTRSLNILKTKDVM